MPTQNNNAVTFTFYGCARRYAIAIRKLGCTAIVTGSHEGWVVEVSQ